MTMAQGFDLQGFVASAERGARQTLLPPGYFAKQSFLQSSDVFNATYGRKVWDSLNNQTRFWNIIRKVQFGPTVGWRLRTDRGFGRSGPISEASGESTGTHTLPGFGYSNYVGIQSDPRTVASVFGVSLKGQIMSGLEGGMGDNLAVEQEAAARDHIKELNQELLLRSYAQLDGNESSNVDTLVDTNGFNSFRRGDVVVHNADNDGLRVVQSINEDGEVTLSAPGTATVGASGNVLYVKARNGFTSLDDLVSHDGLNLAGSGTGASTVDVGVYDVRTATARGRNSFYAGAVNSNNGVGRDLTLNMLDAAIRTVRERGGDPDVILTGYDQLDALAALLRVNQRFLGTDEFVVSMGDDRTLPGTHTGFQIATYKNIPIFPDVDVAKGIASDGTELGSNVYVMDSRYLEIAIAAPTQYIDNRDFFQANSLALRGLFYTIGEFRSYRFDTNYKITDLNEIA